MRSIVKHLVLAFPGFVLFFIGPFFWNDLTSKGKFTLIAMWIGVPLFTMVCIFLDSDLWIKIKYRLKL